MLNEFFEKNKSMKSLFIIAEVVLCALAFIFAFEHRHDRIERFLYVFLGVNFVLIALYIVITYANFVNKNSEDNKNEINKSQS